MPKSTIISFEGLQELRDSININRIQAEIGIGLGGAVSDFHKTLNTAITTRYNVPQSLYSVRQGKKLNVERLGKYVIRNDLVYEYIPVDLARFPYSWIWGNINPGASKEGKVHSVTINKGRTKIVYGKQHFGGFTQKNPNFDGKVQMFERISENRNPLRLLFGPSIAEMAAVTFEYDSDVIKAAQNVEETIASYLTFGS